ncbi:MAG: UDP-N-acetylmuramoyl-L-alanyl-D-glutamate--2,6-diaminopimelate ligase [Candidatus Lernaella stagnicola]|nr:UDP-N-acetylmuramoyl-L-alanyl-D-glutamate--2,6-diaminopimelate ligase [Candidatus Lernaella stagnicola]
MLLSRIVDDLPWATFDRDAEVHRVVVDSRQVRTGDLFVAIRGEKLDGAKFIPQAIAAGASAVAAETDFAADGVARITVADARRFAAVAAHRLAGDPTAGLRVVGITGTNGKTSVTYQLEAIFQAEGRKVGVIGTVNYHYNNHVLAARFTTPEAPDLVAILQEMKNFGVDTVVMEVSSHALQLQRAVGCHFDAGVFTNLSRDHLDFHGALDAYLAAKLRLFEEMLPVSAKRKPHVFAAINTEDAAGRKVREATSVRAITYGAGADLHWIDVECDFDGLRGRLQYGDEVLEVKSPLLGDFQTMNVLAVAAVCCGLDTPGEAVIAGLAACDRIPGRLEPVGKQEFLVLVDYAHTPDALENVVGTLRRLSKGRLIVVFGCGGDRDRGKRPMMGKAVAQQANISLITSDNPRTENPAEIIRQILPGVEKTGRKRLEPEQLRDLNGNGDSYYAVEPDRAAAIRVAIDIARPGDVVLIAGKGHEDYQIIGTERIHFDDREVATEALAKRAKK